MEVGSRVTVQPKDPTKLPDDHCGFGTIRRIAQTELIEPPLSQYWIDLDGLPERYWDWFFEEELSPISEGQPSSRIGDTMVSPPL